MTKKTDEPVTAPTIKSYHRVDVAGAIILITLGLILLLSNFNLLPPDFWATIWRFWPLILILFGFQTLLGGNKIGDGLVFVFGVTMVYLVLAWIFNLPLPHQLQGLPSR